MKVSEITGANYYNKNSNASFSNGINFSALAVTKAANADSLFFNKYVKSGNVSILDFLKRTKMSTDAVFKFLCHLTSDARTSDTAARELSANPRKAEGIKDFLVEKLGGAKKGVDLFWTWFHDEQAGYRQAYANFYNNKVWNPARDLNSLVKQSPNIAPWAFEGKAAELGKEAVLGEVPADFVDLSTYRTLITKLKKSDFHKALMSVKDAEVNSKTSDTMAAAARANKNLQKYIKPFNVEVDGNVYEAKPIVQSFSAKLIYIITPQKDKSKQYILKFDPYELAEQTDRARKFTENQALRADMPYLDGLVDFYLKENKSANAPDIRLFDHKTKSVLYGATKGQEPVIPEKYADNLHSFLKYNKIADLKKLGVELSDVHAGNFIVDNNGNYILIDSGHSKYSNIFRPSVTGRQIILGNLCGRELCK